MDKGHRNFASSKHNKQMGTLITNNKLTLIGVLVGAFAGYMYYHFVGCASGTCLITSHPLNSSLYGALMGGLIFSSFKKNTTDYEQNKNKEK